MQRLAVVALCLSFAAEAVLLDGMRSAEAAEASDSAGVDGAVDPLERQAHVSAKIRRQADADAKLRLRIKVQRREEIKEAAAKGAAARAEQGKAKREADAQLHSQVALERKAEHAVAMSRKHEREAIDRVLEREQERKEMSKLEALKRREEHIRDEVGRKGHALAKAAPLDLQRLPK
mmetsp:Transcript_30805/g.83450  ORF Transcript_30805/g.83450 Transcript_30805/m.83450 type:complete len:177 (-) Transcript_30805:82-612(-)